MTAPKERKVIRCRCSSVLAKDCWQFKDMGGCLCTCHKPDVHGELLAACERILNAERQPGQLDSWNVARALKHMFVLELDLMAHKSPCGHDWPCYCGKFTSHRSDAD